MESRAPSGPFLGVRRRRRGPREELSFLFNSLPTLETAQPEVGSSGWKSTARRVVSGAPPATLENPEDRVPFTLWSMEQCRQGKSAKWIRNLGKRIGSEGWARGSQSRTRRLSVDCSSCSRGESGSPRAGRGTDWERSFGDFPRAQMPRHLISDAHEWINEIPTVPVYYPAKPQPRERAWQNQRGKKTLLNELNENRNLVWNKRVKARLILISSTNTNRESVAYRSFRPSEFEARGVRKVTTGITGLWQPSVHSDVFYPTDDSVAIVIQPSTRGTVDSHNWSSRLVEKPVARSYRALDYD
ncbi:uncharacterized protein LOC109948819 [Prunus persica]|uniref:uncharacterized protein LOC109948788 n=1 Tax=Prunus persica TaxID=3760 RepID=UPI0009AB45C7|nr:uncharacterized protein LOC109948788 [Prunus persica]XP_020418082.1 uncharacterized protein LOC109948791 [Prunus persica]XP_020418084.1 uncharacterized protein LOC109948797 [Prunus persica]XP_020418085.1 uncharacterized protein LOC109948799 [Prunus persica]XP_020418086.1 uncharacterized protein LOC109948800 [Prunus persica]XP_020418087.1 uncharacterized protein LOC109948803 [Prunus persica]XP_020418090.1 uncharacterized protein LOC109948809 [Prunus persica]XP_020418092.1 uncharacterized p